MSISNFTSRFAIVPRKSTANNPNATAKLYGRNMAIPGRYVSILKYLMVITICCVFTQCRKTDTEHTDGDKLPQLGLCKEVPISGNLTYDAEKKQYRYRTSKGGTVTINVDGLANSAINFTYDSFPGFSFEVWGHIETGGVMKFAGNHENLKGKHLKDRLGERRTIILPDETKVTYIAEGVYGLIKSISIYDQKESHHINYTCNKLEFSSYDPMLIKRMDEAEADGETSLIEINGNSLLLVTIYMETTPGNKIHDRYPLGELMRDRPNHINDYYDDPRLAHT